MNSFSKVYSSELEGIDAKIIEVETDINVGLHSFNIVGLADKALSEARERVNSALKNSGAKPPNRENRKITVNLAPADIKKNGSQYDLAIAVGYLLATKQIKEFDAQEILFIGELALDGSLRSVAGALNFAQAAKTSGKKKMIVPEENAFEAATISGIQVFPVKSLRQVMEFLEGEEMIAPQPENLLVNKEISFLVDIADIKGQSAAKRALIVAAAGGHHILMSGSPGGGKTMLARSLQSILPSPDLNKVLEVARIWSAAGLLKNKSDFFTARPFRSPHHTASVASIVGGGAVPRPGEISLAHRGVLFLDEFPEFRRDILEALRQPIESGEICVSRAKAALNFPARFMLVAAMNPCPCGYFGDEEKDCRCSASEVFRYQKKISGPLLDRIDIQIEVPRAKIEDLKSGERDPEEGERARTEIQKARETQKRRFEKTNRRISLNSEMSSREAEEFAKLNTEAEKFLLDAAKKSLISARGYYRILKIGRTIADLEESDSVGVPHLAEAFGYRVREQ